MFFRSLLVLLHSVCLLACLWLDIYEPGQASDPRVAIHIWTWRRPASLFRLLRQLQQLDLTGVSAVSSVDLIFHIDAEASADTLSLAHLYSFYWRKGRVLIDVKNKHCGLPRVFFDGLVETSPVSPFWDHDYGLFLEDDLGISPRAWDWISFSLKAIEAIHERWHGRWKVMGSSLYVPRIYELRLESDDFEPWSPSDALPADCPYFLYQMPCSWGSLVSILLWREFYLDYVVPHLAGDSTVCVLPDAVNHVNTWQTSWKRYALEWMYLKGNLVYFYPNTVDQQSFSTNYMEPGEHFQPDWENYQNNTLRTWHDVRYTVPLALDRQIISQLERVYSQRNVSQLHLVTMELDLIALSDEVI